MPKILVVDDDYSSRRVVYFVLDPGFTILEAHDGWEALRLVEEERPDIVLLDVHLPLVSGPDVCARVKADPQSVETKIVMVTASDDPRDRETSQMAGADAYIVKPFRPSELRKVVDDLLAKSGKSLGATGRSRERWVYARRDAAPVLAGVVESELRYLTLRSALESRFRR